ncbi:cas scaffolding protein family member 4 [Brienomyrus brachyistius]|uniref:cas scaffolding protein family member 4 n=1 Tax=Brienomyrus brachyistius TaxID=42636 RepID=UPI0020B3108E|nr:cas scaffolding protein family member 4 [Brienomyrus brachyistius]
MEMENLLAKALYDNTAECPEELAFRKGDIITVMEQNVDGSHGWWRCSLHGRQGLAPANRLYLLSPDQMNAFAQVGLQTLCAERSLTGSWSQPNIYQTPIVPRPSPSQAYEPMDRIYRVPFSPKLNHELSVKKTVDLLQTSMDKKHPLLESKGKVSPSKIPGKCVAAAEVYDVPNHPLRAFATESNYDVPMSLATEKQQRIAISGCTTLPNLCKSEWVYDVPLKPEKYHGTMMAKPRGQLNHKYDTLPPWTAPKLGASLVPQAYDIPNPSPFSKRCLKSRSTQRPEDEALIYDVPPTLKRQGIAQESDGAVSATRQPQQQTVRPTGDVKEQQLTQDDGGQKDGRPGSDTSSSSTGSCEFPELVREVTLTQEEAARRLAELQEAVSQAVPRLMVFVSSRWRTKDHLAEHIKKIQAAAEDIAGAMDQFLDFVLDVRGNANQLSDANLQLRLHRQLSIVKDSGLILQEAMATLGASWQLNTLVQDSAQAQTPDQLDRFVMVARTIPEDVRHLVSILNANGKLLFRRSQGDPDNSAGCEPETKNSQMGDKQISDSGGEDNDYVHLQTKMEFEKQQMMEQENKKSKQVAVNRRAAAASPHALSEHCRLYFGALQKAIGVFVHSLQDGQPPESFIDKGKLVIMVGQRLVDTLCREAQGQSAGSSQDLLYKGNQLCALLKQLAVATKKAALHYPDKTALQEVEDFAKELAHRAQHFRTQLDQSTVSRE